MKDENKDNEIDKKILNIIESSILKGNADITKFGNNLVSNLKKIIDFDNIKKIILKRLSEKEIYFIRHSEALHNVLERKYGEEEFEKWNVHDPKLTEFGIEQTKKLGEKLKKDKINFESIYLSPLTRTIETFNLIQNDINKDAKVYITDFVKEVLSYCDKNKGKKLSLLKSEYKNTQFNFDYMTKEYWWFDLGEDIKDELEGTMKFISRLIIFILWITFRDEKRVLIISHSHVYFQLQDKGIPNAVISKMNNNILGEKLLLILRTRMFSK